jgi:hypothetical protein
VRDLICLSHKHGPRKAPPCRKESRPSTVRFPAPLPSLNVVFALLSLCSECMGFWALYILRSSYVSETGSAKGERPLERANLIQVSDLVHATGCKQPTLRLASFTGLRFQTDPVSETFCFERWTKTKIPILLSVVGTFRTAEVHTTYTDIQDLLSWCWRTGTSHFMLGMISNI